MLSQHHSIAVPAVPAVPAVLVWYLMALFLGLAEDLVNVGSMCPAYLLCLCNGFAGRAVSIDSSAPQMQCLEDFAALVYLTRPVIRFALAGANEACPCQSKPDARAMAYLIWMMPLLANALER